MTYLERLEGLKKEVLEMKYTEGIDEEGYKLLYHEQTLRIGFNQGIEASKSLLKEIVEEKDREILRLRSGITSQMGQSNEKDKMLLNIINSHE